MTTFVLCFLTLVAGAQPPQPADAAREQQPPPATAAIRGRVIAGDTGQPLRRAEVMLFQSPPPGGRAGRDTLESQTIPTDGDGRYEFRNLRPGRYFIHVNRPPYTRAPQTKPLELSAGQLLDRVDFTLSAGGVITGRIVDEFGEPLPGLDILALRQQMMNGKRQLIETGGRGTTNDIGEFRLFGIEPGPYFLQAVWRRINADDPTSPDRSGYPPTFFPGTTNEEEAQRFTVAAGQTISGLAMAMTPIKTARVEGIVVDINGRPIGNTFLEVLQSSTHNNFMTRQYIRPDGTFTFSTLTPGDYVLRTDRTREAVAMLKLTVGSDDIKDLRLVALPLATLSGRIVVDPSTPPPATLTLMTSPEDNPMPGGTRTAKVADDLTFELSAAPGKNRIVPSNLPPGWTIRAVRVKGIDVIDDGIDVKPGEKITGIDVELTTKSAAINGLVRNTRGEPAKGCTLIIFPTDSRKWKMGDRHVRTAMTDQDGRFTVTGLPGGDYFTIALDAPRPPNWADPDYLERLRATATSVSVHEDETRTVDLKVSTVP